MITFLPLVLLYTNITLINEYDDNNLHNKILLLFILYGVLTILYNVLTYTIVYLKDGHNKTHFLYNSVWYYL